jgi:hypothetical protein
MEYEVLNPLESEGNDIRLINFIEIWIEREQIDTSKVEQIAFDIKQRNELLPIFSKEDKFIYFGIIFLWFKIPGCQRQSQALLCG